MNNISKKWDLNRIPEKWTFSKEQAESVYKKSIATARGKLQPGVPRAYLKRKVNDRYYYRVCYLQPGEQRNFARDLWASYGYYTYYDSKYPDGFYVRKGQ
jgi:hypothetical protein